MKFKCTCGATHERDDDATWHGGQCDDCIISHQYDRAVQAFDDALKTGLPPKHTTEYLARNVEAWKRQMIERGLLDRYRRARDS